MSTLSFNKFWIQKQADLNRHLHKGTVFPLLIKRNKGFFLRKIITRVSDILEFLFLALLSDPTYLGPLIAVFIFFMTAGFFTEWLYLSSKELAIDKKRHSKAFNFSFLLIVNLSALFFFYYKVPNKNLDLISILFLLKFLLFSLQNFSLYKTIDKQSQKRIYVSLLKTNIPQIMTQIIMWGLLLTPLKSQTLFYLGITGFSLAGIISELIYYFYLTHKETAYQRWKSPLKIFQTISIQESCTFILVKNCYFMDLTILSFFLVSKYPVSFYYTFFILISLYRIILRPYRSVLIDLQRVVPQTPYDYYLKFQSQLTGVIIMLAALLIATTHIELKTLVIVSLTLFKSLMVTHKRSTKEDILSSLFTLISFSSFYLLQSEFVVFILLILSILYFSRKGPLRSKATASFAMTLLPFDKKITHTRVDIKQINHTFMSSGIQIEKIIPEKYIAIRHLKENSIDEMRYALSYFIDWEKEEKVITFQEISHKEILSKSLFLKNEKIKILIFKDGETLFKRHHWSINEIKLISNKSRHLDSSLCQLGRKAIYRFEENQYYLLKLTDGTLIAISSPILSDSELEELDQIKLQSLL